MLSGDAEAGRSIMLTWIGIGLALIGVFVMGMGLVEYHGFGLPVNRMGGAAMIFMGILLVIVGAFTFGGKDMLR